MTPKAKEVFEKIAALRRIQKATGMNSSRTQRHLLQTLDDAELAEVAHALESNFLRSALSGEEGAR